MYARLYTFPARLPRSLRRPISVESRREAETRDTGTKFKGRGEVLDVSTETRQAKTARQTALEAELEDWRMKSWMMPEPLEVAIS